MTAAVLRVCAAINRGGRGLSAARCEELEKAKTLLSRQEAERKRKKRAARTDPRLPFLK